MSVVIPCLNEASHIGRLLEALASQRCPPSEIILVDGGSTDGTLSVFERFQTSHPDVATQILVRPGVRIPVAMNEGISAATGAIIVRLDAHSWPKTDYIERVVRLLRETHGGVAGGRWEIEPGAQTTVARAIALAVQHPLGAGDAAYRVGCGGATPMVVDTVPFGCFEKSTWARLGGYKEALATNEDYEFNYRARRAGGRVLLDPQAVSVYTARSTFRTLGAQYFRYGWWKVEMLRRHPAALRWRQALPMLFVLGCGVLLFLSPWLTFVRPWLVWTVLAYVSLILVSSAAIAWRRDGWRTLLVLPLAFPVIHFSWGGGALANIVTLGRWPRNS